MGARKVSLYLIMYSDLSRSSGGRETWLEHFLHECLQSAAKNQLDFDFYIFYWRCARVEVKDDLTLAIQDTSVTFKNLASPNFRGGSLKATLAFSKSCLSAFRESRRKAGEREPFLVSLGFVPELFPSAYLATIRRIPHIVWLRSIYRKILLHNKPWWKRLLLDQAILFLMRRSKAIIANGLDTADYYRSRHGIRSTVISNALAPGYFSQIIFPLAGRKSIGFVGRLSSERGILTYIEAAKVAKARNPTLDFRVLGKGPLLAKVTDSEREGIVSYDGFLPSDKVPNYLRTLGAQVQLVGYGNEGGAGVSHGLLEGMASGVMQIVWDNPIYQQVVDNTQAYLVAEGSVTELAEAFLKHAEHQDESEKKIAKAVARVQDFTMDRHCKQFFTLLYNLR